MEPQLDQAGFPHASAWRRYELCPGSHQLEAEAAKFVQEAYQTPTEASARGDRIHAAQAGRQVALSESEAATAQFLTERADDQLKRIFGDEPVTVLKEQRLWLTLRGHLAASGQFDRVIHNGKTALIQDYKTGWHEPDPADQNSQLKFLAVVVALNLPTVTEVIAQIISGPFGVTETRYDLHALGLAYNDVVSTVQRINDPQATFNPSPEACRWCPAILTCKAVRKLSPPIAKLEAIKLPHGEKASELLDACEVVSGQIESIKEYYARLILSGEIIPNWEMVPGPARRIVTDWHTARQRLEQYIEPNVLDAEENYRLGAIEKALAKKLKLKNSELKAKLAEILAGLIEEKFPEPSLKRIKEKPAPKETYDLS